MTSEELEKAAWKIIHDYEAKTATSDEEEADKILIKVLESIENVMNKKAKRQIQVKTLNDRTNAKFNERNLQKVPGNPFFPGLETDLFFSDIARNDMGKQDRNLLSGVDLILFDKLQQAKLNPFVGHLSDGPQEMGKRTWALAIRW